jgi:hypothetical protein
MGTRFIGIALVALVLTASAYADVVFVQGPGSLPNPENIMFNTNQMGTTIDGFTDISATKVVFTSAQTLVVSGGQPNVDAASGLINIITIQVPGHTFDGLIINPFNPTENGDLMVTAITNNLSPRTTEYGAAGGENPLTITATGGGTVIEEVTISSVGGFKSLSESVSISGVTVIPEPSSMLLLGSGVLGLAQVLRRKLM